MLTELGTLAVNERSLAISPNVVLVSTYDLGHQPFGLASPAAWLRRAGYSVTCLDLAVSGFDSDLLSTADVIGFYLPMHTATRIAINAIRRTRELNRRAHICAFGLYAPMNADHLRRCGADSVIGGEFEQALKDLVASIKEAVAADDGGRTVSLAKQTFLTPDRHGLPPLDRYAHLAMPDGSRRTVGYTEASRGCKHLCRHCPIVPVYNGRFRIVERDVVLADVANLVAQGAEHITFGDPDFFNGIGHAMPLVLELNNRFPDLTYDVTIKVEHLLKHAARLTTLRDTGCLFVTTAVESIDDNALKILDKGHTRKDFYEIVRICRDIGLTLMPTFVAFTPWLSKESYVRLLEVLAELELIENVAPVQLCIRLLIPDGSKLLELPEVRALIAPFDPKALYYPWRHPDPSVDVLQREIEAIVKRGLAGRSSRTKVFNEVRNHAHTAAGIRFSGVCMQAQPSVPYKSEGWYCCAEPTEEQLRPI